MSAARTLRSARRAALAAATLALAVLAAAGPARAQSAPLLDVKVAGDDYFPPTDYLPGQPIPVETALACGTRCGENADWWIWAENYDGTIVRYDGATARWVSSAGPFPDAPSFQRPLADLPLAPLPGTLVLPQGFYRVRAAVDVPMDGVFGNLTDFFWQDQEVYVYVARGFYEDFDDGRAQGFARTPAGEWRVAKQRLVSAPTAALPAVALALQPETHADFSFGADVRCVGGSTATLRRGMGLVFRTGSGYANTYVFHINARGYYTAFRRTGGVTVPLVRGWKFSPAIVRGLGKWNRLEATAVLDAIELWINGVPVETILDTGRTEGRAGVKAFGSAGDRFQFDNLVLRDLFVD